jgi:molecular chaperone HtpG
MADGQRPGQRERDACRDLHNQLTKIVNSCLGYLMDRVGAREMRTFTMHDSQHGLKVAHLMWHILKPHRREHLTPPEIGLLVLAAHLHDLGMGLSDEERRARLAPTSDLWDKVDLHQDYRKALAKLATTIRDSKNSAAVIEATAQLEQANEALLCDDTRERHATPARYQQILQSLREMHLLDPIRIPDIDATLSFDGQQFANKLVDICVSHNENASVLLEPDPENPDQLRFPLEYPVGSCVADLRMVATVLRIADILDFDRERTPPVT